MAYCKECIEKDLKIAELTDTIKSLKTKLRMKERKEEEGYFGLSTSSSQIPFKENSSKETKNKQGGATLRTPRIRQAIPYRRDCR
jgi:hypothetical protein